MEYGAADRTGIWQERYVTYAGMRTCEHGRIHRMTIVLMPPPVDFGLSQTPKMRPIFCTNARALRHHVSTRLTYHLLSLTSAQIIPLRQLLDPYSHASRIISYTPPLVALFNVLSAIMSHQKYILLTDQEVITRPQDVNNHHRL